MAEEFVYSTRKGSASVIGAMRTISFNLNTNKDKATHPTNVVTGLKYIVGSATSVEQASGTEWVVVINNDGTVDGAGDFTFVGGMARVTGDSDITTGVLTVFGYGGG